MERLFLSVVQRGLTASYFIIAVMIARILLKKAPKNMICILWVLAGLRLICPLRFESAFSLLPDSPSAIGMYEADTSQTENLRLEPAAGHIPALDSNLTSDSTPASEHFRHNEEKAATEQDADHRLPLNKIAALWLTGVILMTGYLLYGWRRTAKNVSTAIPAEWEGIRFYRCDRIASPFLFGLAVPKIYVPYPVTDKGLSYVLRHEQAHKNRCDHLIKFTGYLLLAVYWFHPFVWAAYFLLCRDLELACDEQVIKELGEGCKQAYAQALLTYSVNDQAIAAYPVAFGEIGVKERVKNILNYKKTNLRVLLSAVALCLIITVCFATESQSKNHTDANTESKIHTDANTETQNDQDSTAGTDTSAEASKRSPVSNHIADWAEAFCSRNRDAAEKLLSKEGRQAFFSDNYAADSHSFGWSSPWPWGSETADSQPNYRILSFDDNSAVILYYAWTSDPHITVWRQEITYQYDHTADSKDNSSPAIRVTNVQTTFWNSIATADDFYQAYPDGQITGQIDYLTNGVGEALNRNATENDYYDMLFQPDTAAIYLLNLSDDPSKVTTEVSEKDGRTIVTFTFLNDGRTAHVKMVQPYNGSGIWIPQTATGA